MYIYTETGILKKRIIYKPQAENWGKPQAMSENSSYILFRKSKYSESLFLVNVSLEGLKLVTEINIIVELNKHISDLDEDRFNEHNSKLKRYWEKYCENCDKGERIENISL